MRALSVPLSHTLQSTWPSHAGGAEQSCAQRGSRADYGARSRTPPWIAASSGPASQSPAREGRGSGAQLSDLEGRGPWHPVKHALPSTKLPLPRGGPCDFCPSAPPEKKEAPG